MLNQYLHCSIKRGVFSGEAIYKINYECEKEYEGICHPSHLFDSNFTPIIKKIPKGKSIKGFVRIRLEEKDKNNPENIIVDLPIIPSEDKQTISVPKKSLLNAITSD